MGGVEGGFRDSPKFGYGGLVVNLWRIGAFLGDFCGAHSWGLGSSWEAGAGIGAAGFLWTLVLPVAGGSAVHTAVFAAAFVFFFFGEFLKARVIGAGRKVGQSDFRVVSVVLGSGADIGASSGVICGAGVGIHAP